MILKNARVFTPRGFEKCDIAIENGVIAALGRLPGEGEDLSGRAILPGLIDIHTHGCMGQDFARLSDIAPVEQYYHKNGVTTFLPTVISSQREEYSDILEKLHPLRVRLEGPFFAPEKRGAHSAENLTAVDKAWLRGLRGQIGFLDIDPTLPGALALIRELSPEMPLSVAHTSATAAEASAAFEAGARHVTHLFNAMNPLHHREAGVIGAAFEREDVICELICDGLHISPTVCKMAFRLFPGRICLISDSVAGCGLEAGLPIDGQGVIQGALTPVNKALSNLIAWGIDPRTAIESATIVPARALRTDDRIGSIEQGKQADLAVFGNSDIPERVYIMGERII